MASVNGTTARPTAGTSELREAKNENGQKIIVDERFKYIVEKDSFKIVDLKTGENIHVWGDPHVTTGDGDRGQFQRDNLTFDLPNGAKVTIEPTEFANGVAFIKNIAIMKGGKGVEITGVNTNPVIGNVERNAAELDAKYRDGTVLHAGNNIEDLYLPDGSAWVGGDANAAFGERVFDGMGGQSRLNVDEIALGSLDPAFGTVFTKRNGITMDIDGTPYDIINEPSKAFSAILVLLKDKDRAAEGQALLAQMTTAQTAFSNAMKGFFEAQQAIARNI